MATEYQSNTALLTRRWQGLVWFLVFRRWPGKLRVFGNGILAKFGVIQDLQPIRQREYQSPFKAGLAE